MATLSLTRKPPVLSAERRALADVIAERDDADRRQRSVSEAADKADRKALDARIALTAAETAIEDAKKASGDHAVAVADGRAEPGPSPLHAARAWHAQAEQELADARELRDALKERVRQDVGGLYVEDRVRKAAFAVAQAETHAIATRLFKEVAELETTLVRKTRVLRWFADAGVFPKRGGGGVDQELPVDPVLTAILQRADPHLHGVRKLADDPAYQAERVWQQAFYQLTIDATTPLPGAP